MNKIEKITSRENRRLINVRRVRDGDVREQIYVEGRRLVAEALCSGLTIQECYVVEGFGDRELLDVVGKRTTVIAEVPERLFKSIADTSHTQGIVVIAKRQNTGVETIDSRITSAALPIAIFMKEINNPSNLGAVLRTAEAAGVAGLIVSNNSADVYSPKALRAGMGSTFRLPIWEDAALDDVLHWAGVRNLILTAADAGGERNYLDIDWRIPRLLIFGSEAHGLSDANLENIDETVKIPMDIATESLNLGVSAGIILFEAKRQNSMGVHLSS